MPGVIADITQSIDDHRIVVLIARGAATEKHQSHGAGVGDLVDLTGWNGNCVARTNVAPSSSTRTRPLPARM